MLRTFAFYRFEREFEASDGFPLGFTSSSWVAAQYSPRMACHSPALLGADLAERDVDLVEDCDHAVEVDAE